MKHKSSMCLTLCGEIYMLNLDEALLFEADDHYTKIRNLYGNKIMVPFCLGEIEREIRTRFQTTTIWSGWARNTSSIRIGSST